MSSSLMPFHSWPGRLAAADGIAFLYFHGLSSPSRMLFLARSKRFRFDGQKV